TVATPSPGRSSQTRPKPAQTPTRALDPKDRIVEVPIYNTTLSNNWSLQHSSGITYTLSSTAYTHASPYSIATTPAQVCGTLFLTVRPDTTVMYPRDRILGVSFWLTGGANSLTPDDLAVTVVGSNKYPYWVDGDNSVNVKGRIMEAMPVFTETRLR